MTEEATQKPAPRFVGPGAFRVVDLAFPVEFDGVVYDKVTVKRMTVAQLGDFLQAVATDPASARLSSMVDIPIEVFDALFPDDYDVIDEAIRDFLPRRLKTAAETAVEASAESPNEPIQETGATSAPSSPPNSDGAAPNS
jgi:hypothetical protein